jgi:hypothetical protein
MSKPLKMPKLILNIGKAFYYCRIGRFLQYVIYSACLLFLNVTLSGFTKRGDYSPPVVITCALRKKE